MHANKNGIKGDFFIIQLKGEVVFIHLHFPAIHQFIKPAMRVDINFVNVEQGTVKVTINRFGRPVRNHRFAGKTAGNQRNILFHVGVLVRPVLSGPDYANIAEKNKMRNVKKDKAQALTKFMGEKRIFARNRVENKKGEGCFPFTFLRRDISPVTD